MEEEKPSIHGSPPDEAQGEEPPSRPTWSLAAGELPEPDNPEDPVPEVPENLTEEERERIYRLYRQRRKRLSPHLSNDQLDRVVEARFSEAGECEWYAFLDLFDDWFIRNIPKEQWKRWYER